MLEQAHFASEHPANAPGAPLAAGVVKQETLWACPTCRACVTACPVGIEHVPLIVDLRRRLVEDGDMEAGLQDARQSLAKRGNSMNQS